MADRVLLRTGDALLLRTVDALLLRRGAVGPFTQLSLSATPGARYSFSAKTPASGGATPIIYEIYYRQLMAAGKVVN